ncbi:MAG: hypothetical protein FI707_01445 [SAR202 cluster bacterium]|nr:hypothetical protein [SAR202 cluster bacterium]MDP6664592.1 hypothetical protein [SAR202 cluster bacterium]MQG67442.1 hypothetical protein [SAR202 cluster bacterium]HAL47396.1 hypothetical protein [Dehalococcoidia bacterium]|tara:strand:- start:4496 stop:4996 length:501 start_codon:yes stop_codon:yes gene_type:complete
MRNLKLLSAIFAFAIFMAGGSVVYGGLSWTGMDPEVELPGNRGTVNVVFAVPPGTWCKIDGPIDVDIKAPSGSRLVSEQMGQCGVTTDSQMTYGDSDSFSVRARFRTINKKDNFPFQVMISVDGVEQATCAGRARRGVSCEIELDDDDDDDDDRDRKGERRDRRRR